MKNFFAFLIVWSMTTISFAQAPLLFQEPATGVITVTDINDQVSEYSD